jgi:hypothetical protein
MAERLRVSARTLRGWRAKRLVPAIKVGKDVGSEEAGPRVAAIASVVETCRRLKISVRDYLGSILPGLANFPVNRITKLTPGAWAAST